MIRETLLRIGKEYLLAKSGVFGGHALADFLRRGAPQSIEEASGQAGLGFDFLGSPGKGNWTQVPWLAILDPLVTSSATAGYYVVYLFSAECRFVYLSINQGATAVESEFGTGSKSRKVLKERAHLIQARLADFSTQLNVQDIDLKATLHLSQAYEAGHAIGKEYSIEDLPDESTLQSDLVVALNAYRALTFRGGLSLEPEPETQETTALTDVQEKRRMVFHERIERQGGNSKKVKKYHGTICQACDLDMSQQYGEIGKGYIEAHHLIPISALREGEARTYDIAKDFAVLCPNCHRMLHRFPNTKAPNPSDIESFKRSLRLKKPV